MTGFREPEHVRHLREAVALSPDNAPLRQVLGDALLDVGLPAAAATEFRSGLALAPTDTQLKFGLARAFHADGRHGEALVVVEDLLASPVAPARAFVLHARLLAARGDVPQARAQYVRGVTTDPAVANPEVAALVGIDPTSPARGAPDRRPAAYEEIGGGDGASDRVRAAWQAAEEALPPEIDRPRIDFADVGGMEAVKEEIRLKIIHPLTHADLFRAYGKGVGGGVLLYGPPGCGKTHLARATAGEVNAGFIAVGIHDVLDMWIGSSERTLHAIFEQARRHAPCVLFFDEVDALGASRSDMKASAGRHLINQFLAEFDGVQSGNDGVLVLGATNAPWHLDTAFRRPGRFDRVLFVPPPDGPARASILRIVLRGRPVDDVDCEAVARATEGFSGADLRALVDVAVEAKLREAMRSGTPSPLRTRDLLGAVATRRPTTREWFATARNHALFSNQGGAYDDVLKHLGL